VNDHADRRADLVIVNARCVATVDDERRELDGGWVAITDGLVSGVGTGRPPPATTVLDATDCLVTPASSTPTTTCTRTSPGRSRR
jgi:cytosine/adenosine deaminase-related metal-dependent hydrolase